MKSSEKRRLNLANRFAIICETNYCGPINYLSLPPFCKPKANRTMLMAEVITNYYVRGEKECQEEEKNL